MRLAILLSCALLAAGCAGPVARPDDPVVVIDEAFVTPGEFLSDLDSPVVWWDSAGSPWLLVTSKRRSPLGVYDAATGRRTGSVGRRGRGPGEFARANGIAVFADLALVVDRDLARVHVLRLPAFEPVATFGERLRRPYGIAILERSPTEADVYVTDDYAPTDGDGGDPGERVKAYVLTVENGAVAVKWRGSFGTARGPGGLRKVESLAIDPHAGLILIADEQERNFKVYDVSGRFTGRVLWDGLFQYEPEGIVLYDCGTEGGYWIVADQHRVRNRFRVFDRRTFEPLGVFAGSATRYTDGLALTQSPVGTMAAGALYAVHADRAVAAFPWDRVATALGLRSDCGPAQKERPR